MAFCFKNSQTDEEQASHIHVCWIPNPVNAGYGVRKSLTKMNLIQNEFIIRIFPNSNFIDSLHSFRITSSKVIVHLLLHLWLSKALGAKLTLLVALNPRGRG